MEDVGQNPQFCNRGKQTATVEDTFVLKEVWTLFPIFHWKHDRKWFLQEKIWLMQAGMVSFQVYVGNQLDLNTLGRKEKIILRFYIEVRLRL